MLLTDDPQGELRAHLDEVFEGEDFDYDRDVAPWLGERAGFWARPSKDREPLGVLLLAATDTEKAQASLEAVLERSDEQVSRHSHGDSDYLLDDDGVAAGVVGDFLAIGPEAAFKRTVDAAAGDSLAETDEYGDAVGGLEDERLAHFWADTAGLFALARDVDPEARARIDQLSALVPLDQMPPIAASFTADGDHLAVEAKLRGADSTGFGPLLAGGSTPLLQELPGDTWAAMGSADVGESLRTTIDGVAGALGGLVARREIQRRTGLDLDRDLLGWIGDVGFFVRGTTSSTLDGGVVIQPTDEDAAAGAFGRLVGAAQVKAKAKAEPIDVPGADQAFELTADRAPFPIVMARGSGLVAITLGRPAAEAALASGDRLGDTELYAEAEELVGMEPGALLAMPQLLEARRGVQHRPRLPRGPPLPGGVLGDRRRHDGRRRRGRRPRGGRAQVVSRRP